MERNNFTINDSVDYINSSINSYVFKKGVSLLFNQKYDTHMDAEMNIHDICKEHSISKSKLQNMAKLDIIESHYEDGVLVFTKDSLDSCVYFEIDKIDKENDLVNKRLSRLKNLLDYELDYQDECYKASKHLSDAEFDDFAANHNMTAYKNSTKFPTVATVVIACIVIIVGAFSVNVLLPF